MGIVRWYMVMVEKFYVPSVLKKKKNRDTHERDKGLNKIETVTLNQKIKLIDWNRCISWSKKFSNQNISSQKWACQLVIILKGFHCTIKWKSGSKPY